MIATAPHVDAMRHRLLTEVVVRVASSVERDAFVLRGGMLTRAWLGDDARPTRDLDYVGDFAFDRDATRDRFTRALALPAGALRAESMWTDTAFPGVRLGLAMQDQRLSIDVGFHDPLVPPATEITIAGTRVRAVRPETQLAWKLHGLAEMAAAFRPKDVADLALIVARVPLDDAALGPAIHAAFASRGFATATALATLVAAHWDTKTSRARWEPYRERVGELAATIAAVRVRLEPILVELT